MNMSKLNRFNNWLNTKLKISIPNEKFFSGISLFSGDLLKNARTKTEEKLLPVLNGIAGDVLEENMDARAIKMSFRFDYEDVGIEELSKFYDFEDKKPVCILIHGLFGDEYMWKKLPDEKKNKIGDILEKQLDANILYLRYNTGLHISENGRSLSNLLERFVKQYRSGNIHLIGHSMGGLLIRSAGYYADIQQQEWNRKVKNIFLIGVPNEGSYVAQIAEFVNKVFRKVDISKDELVSKFLDIRSNGIKDLAYAYLTDEDWLNAKEKPEQKTRVRPLKGVKYFLIAGTLGKNKMLSTYFGDGLVGSQSAISENIETNFFTNVSHKVFENEDHISLLSSLNVAEYIVENIKNKQ